MNNDLRYLLHGLILVVTILIIQTMFSTAAVAQNNYDETFAQGQLGKTASPMSLSNLDGTEAFLDFKGKPTVVISIHEFRINRLADFQTFYDKYKKVINFYIVCYSDSERVKQVFSSHGFTMPVLLDNKEEFINKHNSWLPSMLITDKSGIIRYNSTAFIDIQSLDDYMGKMLENNVEDLPEILKNPFHYKQAAPPELNIGDVVTNERFYDFEGNYITINYSDKPTILLFWAGFNGQDALDRTLPVIQEVYQNRGSTANFYTVNFTDGSERAKGILDSYNITVPSLRDRYPTVTIKYTYALSTFVIIDKNGVIRFRPKKIDAEQLETIIDSLNSPDDAALAEKAQNIDVAEAS